MTGPSLAGSVHWQLVAWCLPLLAEVLLVVVLPAADLDEAAVSRPDVVRQSVERLPEPTPPGELSVSALGLYLATRHHITH